MGYITKEPIKRPLNSAKFNPQEKQYKTFQQTPENLGISNTKWVMMIFFYTLLTVSSNM